MDRARIEAEMAELGVKREELAAQIPAATAGDLRSAADETRRTAVSAVENYLCKVCHNSVPRDVVTRYRGRDTHPVRELPPDTVGAGREE